MTKGYNTEKQQRQLMENTAKEMIRKGLMTKDHIVCLDLDTKPKDLKAGDLVMTFEIMVVRKPLEHSTTKDEFDVVHLFPPCSVDHIYHGHEKDKWTRCQHSCIKRVAIGQQGIVKIVKVKRKEVEKHGDR